MADTTPNAGGAPPTPAPANTLSGSAAPAGAGFATNPQPARIASVDDLIESAEDRRIPRGSTVRMSPDHAELRTKVAIDEVNDSLEACGVKLVLDTSVPADAILVEPPKAK